MSALPVSSVPSTNSVSGHMSSLLQSVSARWQAFNPREKTLISAAAALVGLALLWWVGIAPALKILKTVKTQGIVLDAQLQQMQGLQAQAKALQAQPKIKNFEAARALETLARQRLGANTQVSVVGNQASLQLTGASPDALAQFLSQARASASALPSQARLRRSVANPQAWDGTLVLSLPVSGQQAL